jgi:hypothetical protein
VRYCGSTAVTLELVKTVCQTVTWETIVRDIIMCNTIICKIVIWKTIIPEIIMRNIVICKIVICNIIMLMA